MNIVKEKNRHRENGGSFLGVFIFLGWMSHILELNSKRQKRRPLRQISARLQAVPCVICLQWFVSKRLFSYPVVELGREVEFAIAEMACVSRNVRRTFHVPSGVPVQRSISGRDVSHPVVELEKAETTSTSTNSRTTASSPLRYLSPVIRF